MWNRKTAWVKYIHAYASECDWDTNTPKGRELVRRVAHFIAESGKWEPGDKTLNTFHLENLLRSKPEIVPLYFVHVVLHAHNARMERIFVLKSREKFWKTHDTFKNAPCRYNQPVGEWMEIHAPRTFHEIGFFNKRRIPSVGVKALHNFYGAHGGNITIESFKADLKQNGYKLYTIDNEEVVLGVELQF